MCVNNDVVVVIVVVVVVVVNVVVVVVVVIVVVVIKMIMVGTPASELRLESDIDAREFDGYDDDVDVNDDVDRTGSHTLGNWLCRCQVFS